MDRCQDGSQKPVANILKKNPEKSQIVFKNLQIDELCPMKHESHNFAWLETSKREPERH